MTDGGAAASGAVLWSHAYGWPVQLAAVRAGTREFLNSAGVDRVRRDDIVLATMELVTNACEACAAIGQGTVAVGLRCQHDRVTVEVTNVPASLEGVQLGAVPMTMPGAGSERGRGLALVAAMALRLSVDADRDRTRVVAEFMR